MGEIGVQKPSMCTPRGHSGEKERAGLTILLIIE